MHVMTWELKKKKRRRKARPTNRESNIHPLLMHSFSHPLTHVTPQVCSWALTHSLTRLFIRLTHSFIYSLTRYATGVFLYYLPSFIHLLIHSFIHTLACPSSAILRFLWTYSDAFKHPHSIHSLATHHVFIHSFTHPFTRFLLSHSLSLSKRHYFLLLIHYVYVCAQTPPDPLR